MKIALIYLQGRASNWAELACKEYEQKVSAILPFEQVAIRSPSRGRPQADKKRDEEGLALLKFLKESSDKLILFEEGGLEVSDSKEFSRFVVQKIALGGRLVFAIGGPYGFSLAVKRRALATVSLSRLTFNHHLARVVALEQIYRALTIWRGLPYHNE